MSGTQVNLPSIESNTNTPRHDGASELLDEWDCVDEEAWRQE